MNLANTAQVALEEAFQRYIDSLMDTAISTGYPANQLVNELRAAQERYKAVEQSLNDL